MPVARSSLCSWPGVRRWTCGSTKPGNRCLPPASSVSPSSGSASDPAGAYVDGDTAARAKTLGLDPAAFLADNDSTGFFSALGDLLVPGPTFTNVNDFRAIVVDRT